MGRLVATGACVLALVLQALVSNRWAARAYRRRIDELWAGPGAAARAPPGEVGSAPAPGGAQTAIDMARESAVPFTAATVATGDRVWRTAHRPPLSAEVLQRLPPVAARCLRHFVAEGPPWLAPLSCRWAALSEAMGGAWLEVQADEVIAPERGSAWRATARVGGLPITGADYYVNGQGEVRFRLLGLFTVTRSVGESTSKSGLGRLVAETTWCPPALLLMRDVMWEEHDQGTLRVLAPIGRRTIRPDLTLNADGAVREAIVDRHDDGGRSPDREYIPFRVGVEQERTLEGYTTPAEVQGGWLYGEDG